MTLFVEFAQIVRIARLRSLSVTAAGSHRITFDVTSVSAIVGVAHLFSIKVLELLIILVIKCIKFIFKMPQDANTHRSYLHKISSNKYDILLQLVAISFTVPKS